MTRQQILGVIGLWTMVLPFFGIPNSWKMSLVSLTGIAILILYWRSRKESISESTIKNGHGAGFVENSFVKKTLPTIDTINDK